MTDNQKTLEELFTLADKVGKKRYNRLTKQDFEDYRKFDHWRYVNGNSECGTTPESKKWVRENSEWKCPVCNERYSEKGGRTIDHKLPRAQYPWLSLDFRNFWVICRDCNQEKGERHWYEYEHYYVDSSLRSLRRCAICPPSTIARNFIIRLNKLEMSIQDNLIKNASSPTDILNSWFLDFFPNFPEKLYLSALLCCRQHIFVSEGTKQCGDETY